MPDLRVIRDVTVDECPWLEGTIVKGALLWHCDKPTYGCVSPSGIAVTAAEDRGYPFFELPQDAVEDIYKGSEK